MDLYYWFTVANCYLFLVIFVLFPVALFIYIFLFFSSFLFLPLLFQTRAPSSPLSRSNQTHSLSHLRSNSHRVFVGHTVGLFKVDHVVSLFVAVEMGSDWVVGCCGGSGLLIRPWVAVDVVGRLVAVGMGRCDCVGGGVRRSEWLVFGFFTFFFFFC